VFVGARSSKEHVVVAAFARGSAGRSPRRKATLQARHGQLRAGQEPGMFSAQPPAENVCDAAKAVDVFFFRRLTQLAFTRQQTWGVEE